MKSIKLFFLLILLFLIVCTNCLERSFTKLHTKSHLKKTTQLQIKHNRNDFYGICFNFENCDSSSSLCHNNCNEALYDTVHYNCSDETALQLKNAKDFKTHSFLLASQEIPFYMKFRVAKATHCKNYREAVSNKFGDQHLLLKRKQKIRFINGFLRKDFEKDKNFYEIGADVFTFFPVGKKLNFAHVIQQMNISQDLLKKSIDLGLPNPKNVNPFKIEDLVNGDLKIVKADLFLEKFVLSLDIYHQVLYVCAKGSQYAYHFYIDRAMRNPGHEYDTLSFFQKLAQGAMITNKAWRTLIRFVYYHRSNECTEEGYPDNFVSRHSLARQSAEIDFPEYEHYFKKENTSRFVPKTNLKSDVDDNRSSLKNLFAAVQRYALRFRKYSLNNHNCQHFATGFYNYLTKSNIKYVNHGAMFGVSSDPFEKFFDDSDEVFNQHIEKDRNRSIYDRK